jgi:rotatin
LKPDEFFLGKAAAINALKSLLAISNSAKMAALEAGLMETLFEHMQRLHKRLNSEVLELAKTQIARKKSNSTLTELLMIIELLRNFLYRSEDVKNAACKNGLANLVHTLWTWCQLDSPLMLSVLALLSCYTANCLPACSSLAMTTNMIGKQEKLPPMKLHISSNSLVHCLVRLLQKEANLANRNQTILKQGFSLVSNLALSQECRGILWKSNFLVEFSAAHIQQVKKSKPNILDNLWLNLLVMLSFSTDGQNMILKINDGLALLIEFGSTGLDNQQKSAILVLRNLCFHSSNKPKLLSNG